MDRKLAAILAADVVGYSGMMEQDEAGTFERLRSARKEVFEPRGVGSLHTRGLRPALIVPWQMTPTVYVNGRCLSGAQSYDTFVVVIEEELSKTK